MVQTDYKKFFEHSVDMLSVAGFDGYFKDINQSFCQTLGYSREELLSKPFISFVHPEDAASTLHEMDRLNSGVRTQQFENRYLHADGYYIWLGWSASPDLQDQLIYGVARNITSQKQMAKNLLVLSQTDTNTSIPNRKAFEMRFKDEWNEARRYQYPISLLIIDIDHFKAYNDHYGHQMGDECIRLIAQCLNTHLPRANDLLARIGGDEFAVILPHESLENALKTGEYLKRSITSLQQPHKFNNELNYVTITIGISTTTPAASASIENFIAVADKSLYEAKRAGRNCCRGHFWDNSAVK